MNKLFDWICAGISSLATMIQTNETMQYIQIAISIICGLLALTKTIVELVEKHKKDGKITLDEVKETIDVVEDKIQEIGKDIKQ